VFGVDGQSCVVGADSEGYIPLRFTRGQTIDIVLSPTTHDSTKWSLVSDLPDYLSLFFTSDTGRTVLQNVVLAISNFGGEIMVLNVSWISISFH